MDFSKVILMTDLDGTLLTDDKRILPQDLEAIERFRAGGGLFTMATGRGYSMAKHIADKLRLDCPAVVYNGAAVYDFRQEVPLAVRDREPRGGYHKARRRAISRYRRRSSAG